MKTTFYAVEFRSGTWLCFIWNFILYPNCDYAEDDDSRRVRLEELPAIFGQSDGLVLVHGCQISGNLQRKFFASSPFSVAQNDGNPALYTHGGHHHILNIVIVMLF